MQGERSPNLSQQGLMEGLGGSPASLQHPSAQMLRGQATTAGDPGHTHPLCYQLQFSCLGSLVIGTVKEEEMVSEKPDVEEWHECPGRQRGCRKGLGPSQDRSSGCWEVESHVSGTWNLAVRPFPGTRPGGRDLQGGCIPGLVLVPSTSRPSRSTHQQ